MSSQLRIKCLRAQADEVEEKLKELDSDGILTIEGDPKLSGIVDTLSIVASISTIAASAFAVWAEAQRKAGKRIEVEKNGTEPASRDSKNS